MIFKTTLKQAYQTAGIPLSEAELNDKFEEMTNDWETRTWENLDVLTQNWKDKTGQPVVDAMTRGTLLQWARQQAAETVHADWLEPLAPLTEDNLNEGEEEPSALEILESPTLWMKYWDILLPNDTMYDLANELWPDASPRWINLAAALMQVREHQDKPYPTEPNSELMPEFEIQIKQALARQ